MKNRFRISLRCSSDTVDFQKTIPKFADYAIAYNRKGESVISNKTSSFKALANTLVVKDVYIADKIDVDSDIINKLLPVIRSLSVIDVDDLIREVSLAGTIKNQQFGFLMNHDFINLLAENNYSFVFYGIALL
jgi:hypothetical protein